MATSNREYDDASLYKALQNEGRANWIREDISEGEVDFASNGAQATISFRHEWLVSAETAQRILRSIEDGEF